MSALRTADFQERRRARSAMVTRRVQMIDNAIEYLAALDAVLENAELGLGDRQAVGVAVGDVHRALERAREVTS